MDPKDTVKQTAQGITCNSCGRVFTKDELLDLAVRPVVALRGVLETGISCPDCKTFFHAEYTNDRLISMYRDYRFEKRYIQKNSLLRSYKRKNASFQKEIELQLLRLQINKDLSNEQLSEQSAKVG